VEAVLAIGPTKADFAIDTAFMADLAIYLPNVTLCCI
jgi:hypothetical protein